MPLLLLSVLFLQLTGHAGEAGTVGAPATAPVAADPAEGLSLHARETKQYVAKLTEERNQLRAANETLGTRQGLLIGHGVLMTLLVVWLGLRALTKPAVGSVTAAHEAGTDAFPAGGTTGIVRKNATITIRNGATQQAEVTGQVQTRRAFARGDTDKHQRRPVTTTVVRNQPAAPATSRLIAPELEPARRTTPTPLPVAAPTPVRPPTAQQRAATVRVEQSSDRLAPVEVQVKPGTAPVSRRGA